jgi:hypothetical protein
MKVRVFAAAMISLLSCIASAQDLRDQLNIQTGKAELVIPEMQPQDVANQVQDALAQFSIPANLSYRTLPSEAPARPAEPTAKQVYVQGTPAIEYQCEAAYAEVTKRPPPVQNAFYFNAENLQACMYSFKGGVKVYLIFTVMKKTESLTSGLFNGITKAIRGDDGDRITGQLTESIEAIRKNIQTVLVERLEAPGKPVQEPDKAAVAVLMPATTVPVATQTEPVVQNVNQPETKESKPSSIDLSLVGARKELTAMGFKFYDQDQFVDSARRNDYLTVRLFLAACGISPSGPDSRGETALALSSKNPQMNMILTAFAEAEKVGQYPGNIAEAVLAK